MLSQMKKGRETDGRRILKSCLTGQNLETHPDIPPAEHDLPIGCSPRTKDEIRRAIKEMKNGKSAGPDGIPAEALKAEVDISVEMLQPLFLKI